VLSTLLDLAEGSPLPLPEALVSRYGGRLAFPALDRPYVFANFVSTLDGITSYALPGRSGAALISEHKEADRFLLGLLRACADVVVVGAGTLRAEGKHVWTAAHVYKPAAADFAALRSAMGKPEHPLVAFVTASGKVDLGLPAFRGPGESVLITTDAGAARLGTLPPRVRVHVIAGASRAHGNADGARPSAREVLDAVVAESGARLVLTEGGPALLGAWLRESLVDELFLTVAPRLAGRSPEERRLALVEGAAFTPEDAPRGQLLSAKRADDYLFLRYALRG